MVDSECWPLTPRYVGELISDSEADVREEDSYLFDLDNKVTLRMDAKGLHSGRASWRGLSWDTNARAHPVPPSVQRSLCAPGSDSVFGQDP